MAEQRIFRYEVPVDDQVRSFELGGNPLAVGCRQVDVVEFWALSGEGPPRRNFLVVGTGHPLPPTFKRHWGTAVAPGGQLVWHLVEVWS